MVSIKPLTKVIEMSKNVRVISNVANVDREKLEELCNDLAMTCSMYAATSAAMVRANKRMAKQYNLPKPVKKAHKYYRKAVTKVAELAPFSMKELNVGGLSDAEADSMASAVIDDIMEQMRGAKKGASSE